MGVGQAQSSQPDQEDTLGIREGGQGLGLPEAWEAGLWQQGPPLAPKGRWCNLSDPQRARSSLPPGFLRAKPSCTLLAKGSPEFWTYTDTHGAWPSLPTDTSTFPSVFGPLLPDPRARAY